MESRMSNEMQVRRQGLVRQEALKRQAYGDAGEDMSIVGLARRGIKTQQVEKLVIFDWRQVQINAAGGIPQTVLFFGNSRGSHPLGQWATNLERDQSLPINKEWIIKDIGVSIMADPDLFAGVTPANVFGWYQNIAGIVAQGHVITVDGGNRELDRGAIMHYPSGNPIQQRTPMFDNPAAVAVYQQNREPWNYGPAQKRNGLRIDWYLGKGQSFACKLDLPPINFPAAFATMNFFFGFDMTVTQFSEVS